MHLLEFAINSCLAYFYELTGSYIISLILLSFAVSACLAPFYYLTGILENKERTIKQRLEPFIQKINTIKDSKTRHFQLSELYNSFSYYPFYALRSLASLFIQIPILIVAYEALSNYSPLKDIWLGYPDKFFNGFNALPFLMTLINLCSVFISSQPNSKERQQGIFIAMVFFVLLYTSPAALLIYWTFNQLFNFIRYLMVYPIPKIKNITVWNFDFIWQFMLVLSIHSIFCIFIGKAVYEIFVIFSLLIIYKFIKKAKIYFSGSKFKNNIILNISVMAFPAILIFKSNTVYFDRVELFIYVIALFLFSVMLSLFLHPKFSVSFILSLMFLPLVREVTYYASGLWISFLVLFVVVFIFVSSAIKQKGAIMAFSLMASAWILFFAGNVNFGSKSAEELSSKKVQIPEELAKLELKDSTSIYLFMHDAFPHSDYAKYFDMPYDGLMDVFEENGFKIYNVYSMGYNTITAMASVLAMRTDILPKYNNTTTAIYAENINDPKFDRGFHSGYFKTVTSGNSITNILLQKNNYTTYLLKPHPYDQSFRGYEYYDSIYYDNEGTVKIKNQVLKNILNGTLNSDLAQGSLASHMISISKFMQNNFEKNKIFMWGQGCPGHSSQGLGTTEKELQNYIPLYNECLDSMKKEIEMIKENNNAIVIFMSDHGGFFLDDGKRFPKNYDFNKTDYMKFRDVFGAFMAVRWPNREKAEKYDGDFNVSQDIFPIVFAYLFDSEIPLKYKVQNSELRLGFHKFDKGVFYKDFYKGETK